ncbi:MAG: hypothetical protein ACLTKE_04025 [Coprococcus sp.]
MKGLELQQRLCPVGKTVIGTALNGLEHLHLFRIHVYAGKNVRRKDLVIGLLVIANVS